LRQPIRANNGSALQNFSIALDQAKSAMKGMFHMDDLKTTHVHVVRQKQWTERNNKTKSTKGRIAGFEEFSQLVREQAKQAMVVQKVFQGEGVHHISQTQRHFQ